MIKNVVIPFLIVVAIIFFLGFWAMQKNVNDRKAAEIKELQKRTEEAVSSLLENVPDPEPGFITIMIPMVPGKEKDEKIGVLDVQVHYKR
jgi:hypothetical protein